MRTGRSEYLLYEGATYSARPSQLLGLMHERYNFGRNLGSRGNILGSENCDITIDEARRQHRQAIKIFTVLMAAAYGGIGAAVGVWRGAVTWGVVTGLLCLLPAWGALIWLNRASANLSNPVGRQTLRLLVPLLVLGPLLTGLVLGYLSSSWQAGMIIGGSVVCLSALFTLLTRKMSTLLR